MHRMITGVVLSAEVTLLATEQSTLQLTICIILPS